MGYSFIIQGEQGLEKPASSFLGVLAPPWYPVRCVFKSAEGWSSNSCPWSEYECSPHPIQNSQGSTNEGRLPCAEGFFEQSLTYIDLPMSPKFPSLNDPLLGLLQLPVPTPSLLLGAVLQMLWPPPGRGSQLYAAH